MNIFPLTDSQQRLWIEWKIDPTSKAYNLNMLFKLTGNLKIECLKEALNLIVKKHEALRTYFIEDNSEPFQIILPPQNPIFNTNSMHVVELGLFNNQLSIDKEIYRATHQVFDLKVPLLYKFCLIKVESNVYYFVVTMHHIISDGISMELFVKELAVLYNNLVQHQQNLMHTEKKLSNYLEHAKSKETIEKHRISIEYWKNMMVSANTQLHFHTTSASFNNKSCTARFVVASDLLKQINKLAFENNTTIFLVLMAAFKVLLYRYFNSKNIVVGYAVNIRPKGLEDLFGFYVNNIPLKTEIADSQTFIELLKTISKQRLNDRQHQDLSLQEIVKNIQNKSEVDKLAPFNVTFNQVSSPVLGLYGETHGLNLHELKVEPLPVSMGDALFDLTFLYANVDEQLHFTIDYKASIFENWFINQMIAHFQTILMEICKDPTQQVSHIQLLTENEKNTMLVTLRGETVHYPQDKTPSQLFVENAQLFPDTYAVIHNERQISYKELNEKSNQLANYLLAEGVVPGALVAVGLERSLEYVISILAIMKAGCGYVPIDPEYPEERIKFILKDANAKFFIVNNKTKTDYSEYAETVFYIDNDWYKLLKTSKTEPQVTYNINNSAYVIYTSGTTGFPKGVQVSINSLLNLIFWHKATYLTEDNRSYQASVVAGTGFDASVWEIWPYLVTGSTLHIADQETILDPEKLIAWLIKEQINISFLPTPVAEIFIKKSYTSNFSDLFYVLTGGEQLKIFPAENSSFKVFNHYGPTENTVVTTQARVLTLDETNPISVTPNIGSPISNVGLYVLDENLQLVPRGVIGELYIDGVGLSQGYLHREDLTAKNFVANHFPVQSSNLMYKTGDLVRCQLNGELNFVGRIDEQVKMRGFRIELAEIETQLLKHPSIAQCAVILKPDNNRTNYLVAYYVVKSAGEQIETNMLQEFLKQTLPAYMVPSLYVSVDKMPLTLNGKIDKKVLLGLATQQFKFENIIAPRNKTEKKLLQIWSKVLGISNLGIYDNFFALGGHSLLISAVILAVKKAFAVDIPFRSFFDKPTIDNLAHLIDTANDRLNNRRIIDTRALELRKTILLAEDIQVPSAPTPPHLLQNILITGTSGFLGAYLLEELFYSTKATFYCLVRATDIYEAQVKLKNNFIKYNINDHIFTSGRIKIILGDITTPCLGLDKQLYNTLVEKIDSIYHCGAQVHHIYSYDILEAANVFSTIEIIKLAALKKHKHIHYVSAVSAARQNLDSAGFIIEDFLQPDPGHINILDGYNQTKLASELLLTTAKERGFSVNIYRPAWIGGHSLTGACSLEHQHLFLLIKGCIQMGYAPNWQMGLNIVPVDFISKFITLVSTSPHVKEQVFNLVNTSHFTWMDLMQWINNYGYKVTIIPKNEWRLQHLNKIRINNALYPLVPLYIGGDTSKHTQNQIQELKIRNANTMNVSKTFGLACPAMDNSILEIYFQYLHKSNFIEVPKNSNWSKNLKTAAVV